jgi:hypothetical protein
MRLFKQESLSKRAKGTISQGIRANDLRVSRFFGKDKTHLKHIFTVEQHYLVVDLKNGVKLSSDDRISTV